MLVVVYRRYGLHFFTPLALRRVTLARGEASYEAEGSVEAFLREHEFVFVAGVHRSGTTLMAQLLAEHPRVGGLGTDGAPRPPSDFDEGMFVQSVIPLFGISAEGLQSARLPGGERAQLGLGRWAHSPTAHITERRADLLTPAQQAKLLGEWAFFWNTSLPVLLEKSPPNIMWARYLAAAATPPSQLWPKGAACDDGLGAAQASCDNAPPPIGAESATEAIAEHSRAKFVLMKRHPIAVALAHWQLGACKDLSVRQLVEHWLLQMDTIKCDAGIPPPDDMDLNFTSLLDPNEEVEGQAERSAEVFCARARAAGVADVPALGVPAPLKGRVFFASLEGLARSPLALRILSIQLGLDKGGTGKDSGGSSLAQAHERLVKAEPPNAKYATQYDELLASSDEAREAHAHMIAELGDAVKQHGYDLADAALAERTSDDAM